MRECHGTSAGFGGIPGHHGAQLETTEVKFNSADLSLSWKREAKLYSGFTSIEWPFPESCALEFPPNVLAFMLWDLLEQPFSMGAMWLPREAMAHLKECTDQK